MNWYLVTLDFLTVLLAIFSFIVTIYLYKLSKNLGIGVLIFGIGYMVPIRILVLMNDIYNAELVDKDTLASLAIIFWIVCSIALYLLLKTYVKVTYNCDKLWFPKHK